MNAPGAFGAVDAGFDVPGLLPLPDLENYDEEQPCLDRAALTAKADLAARHAA